MVARLRQPLSVAQGLLGWASLPLRPLDLLPYDAKDLKPVIAWDSSVELAVVPPAGNEDPPFILSVGLTGLDAGVELARQRGLAPERVAQGIYRVRPFKKLECAIAGSLGPSPARLACAPNEAALNRLLPYATRGLPAEKLAEDDFFFELRAEPARQRYGKDIASARVVAGTIAKQLEIDFQRFDRAVTAAAFDVAEELKLAIEDADYLRLKGSLNEQRGAIELALQLRLQKQSSWAAGVVSDTATFTKEPPPAFFRLPADASSAAFVSGFVPTRLDGIKKALVDITDAYLDYNKIGAPARKRAEHLIQGYLSLSGGLPIVSAEGVEPGEGDLEAREFGLWLLPDDSKKLTELQGDFAALLGDKALRKALAEYVGVDAKQLPKARVKAWKRKGLPAGSSLLELDVPDMNILARLLQKIGSKGPRVPPPIKPGRFLIAVTPDGTGSAIGVGRDEAILARRLEALLSGTGPTLGERAGNAELRAVRASYFAFVTLEAMARALAKDVPGVPPQLLQAAPNRGQTPITVKAVGNAGPPLELTLKIEVPKGVAEDLGALGPALMLR
jgi:hypothetical protein